MAAILSHPFRLTGSGVIATVEQDSDQANAEMIAVLCTTMLEERPLAPGFGITDPVFGSLDTSEVLAGVAAHGPDVQIADITTAWDSDSTQLVTVHFD